MRNIILSSHAYGRTAQYKGCHVAAHVSYPGFIELEVPFHFGNKNSF
jgi:hypothetical protein